MIPPENPKTVYEFRLEGNSLYGVKKISIEGHTYFIIDWVYAKAGFHVMHDPDCKKCIENGID